MQLGARIIKSGLSVILSLYVAKLLGFHSLAFVGIAAFLAIQPSIYRSWKHLFSQLIANVVGAIVSISFVYLFGNEPIVVGLAVVLLVSIHVSLKQFDSITISSLTVIAIMEIQNQHFISFASERFFSILLGILCAILINILFFPPKYEKKLLRLIQKHLEESSIIIRNLVLNQLTPDAIKVTLEKMDDNNRKINDLYLLHIEQFKNRFNKYSLRTKKKTIIIQKMIKILKKEKYLINTFQEYRLPLQTLDQNILNHLQQHLYLLTNYEEKIILKLNKKVLPTFPCDLHNQTIHSTNQLRSFLEHFHTLHLSKQSTETIKNEKNSFIPFVILFTAIFELTEQTIQFDRYVTNYRSKNLNVKKTKKHGIF